MTTTKPQLTPKRPYCAVDLHGNVYPLPIAPTWSQDPPPAEGWWPCSAWGDPSEVRFWDGNRWSFFVDIKADMRTVVQNGARRAMVPARDLRWCARWWADNIQGSKN